MDDVVKRRIAGALLLVVVAFIGVSLLPEVRHGTGESGVQIVTIALDGSAPEVIVPPTATVVPPVIAAPPPMPAAAESAAPAVEGDADGESSGVVEDPGTEPAPETPPPPKPAPAVVSKLPPVAAPAPAPAVKPVQKAIQPAPAPIPEIKPAPPAAKPPPASTAAGSWYVQVGGFADIANAHQAQDRLKAAGQASIIAPAETARGTLYRVRAGPYSSREAATAARAALVAAGFAEPAVVGP